MNRTWELTDLEFVVAWEDMKGEFLPHPFVFTSRTPLWNDYLREKKEVRKQLETKLDHSFSEILTRIAQPDIRLEVTAWDSRATDDPKSCIRILAVRLDADALVVTQLPGETVRHSGGFTLAEADPLALADIVVAALPKADAGHRREVVLTEAEGATRDEDFDYSYRESEVFDSFDDSVGRRSTDFLNAPTGLMGVIRIVQGRSRFGPRGIVHRTLRWRDLLDDGRYMITADNPPIARPVSAKQMIAMVNSEIVTVVRAIKDERM
ncbi:ESX secretion-associated protein EspG [Nocardia sp. X0981]